jgi:hypothetical protein
MYYSILNKMLQVDDWSKQESNKVQVKMYLKK